jgi:hypothetical protein
MSHVSHIAPVQLRRDARIIGLLFASTKVSKPSAM